MIKINVKNSKKLTPYTGIHLSMPHSSNHFSCKMTPPNNLYDEWQALDCHLYHILLCRSFHMCLTEGGLDF